MPRRPARLAAAPPLALLAAAALALAGCGAAVPTLPIVSIAPTAAAVQAGGGTQQFTATVTNAPNTAVVWKVNGHLGGDPTTGTITQAGLYAAPAQVPAGAITVSAVSVDNANVSASATVTLNPPITVTVTPATVAGATPGQAIQFQATVANAQNTAVTWGVNGTAGGDPKSGLITASGLYTAPATFQGLNSVTISATSVQDPQIQGTATVTLTPGVAVVVSPPDPTVNLGSSQQFTATVTGSANTGVSWSVNGTPGGSATLGTIDKTGLFAAPSQLPAPATETVTATSLADATRSGSTTLTLQVPPAAFSLSPASSALALGKAQSGTVALQVTVSPGFANPIAFTVAGAPVNVAGSVAPASLTASGTVTLTLATASIALAQSGVPITVTATSQDAQGHPLVQTATVLLTVTGWAGHVHTLAGGPGGVGFEDGTGTADELYPTALTSDGGRNVYFSDKRGNALRAFGLLNQTVSTIDGSPYSFTVGEGDGMAFDPASQTIYIADGLQDKITAFTVGSATPRTLAAGFNFPHGLALSPDHATLYVADTGNEVIRSVNVATGAVAILAGQPGVFRSTDGTGTGASFCQPTGLALDPQGANLYVSDQCGFVIRQIALPSLVVSTVAGNGTVGQADGSALAASFKDPVALAVDPHPGANLVYIADGNAVRALRLAATPAAGSVFTLAGAADIGQSDGAGGNARFYQPSGLTALADIAGPSTTTLFLADSLNGLLRRLDLANPASATATSASLNVSTVAGQPSHRGAADGAGTGANFAGASVAEFSQPEGIATDGKTAYVVDSENGAVRKIDLASTTVTTVAGPHQGFADGPAASASFFQPAGIAWDQARNLLYIADAGNGAIRKLDLNAQQVTTIAGAAASGFVNGPGASARFNHPFGVLLSPDGNTLYVADTGNNAIRAIDLTSSAFTVSTIAGTGGLGHADGAAAAATFAEPNGLVFDATGKIIYISDFENQEIRALDLTAQTVSTLVGVAHHCGFQDGPAAQATLCNPAFLASDGRSLFWGDANEGLLRVLDLATMQVSTLAGQPALMHMADGDLAAAPGELTGPVRYNGVFGLALAPDDSFLLFTDKTANVIRILN